MNFSRVVFSILSTIFLLSMTAVFAAGSLIFLMMQFYNYIFETSGFWIALGTVVPTVILFFCIFLQLIKHNFLRVPKSKEPKNKKPTSAVQKIVISVLVYELTRFISKLLHNHSDKKHAKHV